MARGIVGAPADFFIAMGHGRSYGQRSSLLGRRLPGITECGLWEALGKVNAPTSALITDIGNDVIYGVPVQTILKWVIQCVDRLQEIQATIVVTLPPMASLEKLTPWRFRVARSLLFPGRRITLDDTLDRTRTLHAGLGSLGGRPGLTVVEPEGRWYGLDPIHPRRRFLAKAWQQALGPWAADATEPPRARLSPRRWLRLRTITPQQWWLLGRELGQDQPSGQLGDGTSFWLF